MAKKIIRKNKILVEKETIQPMEELKVSHKTVPRDMLSVIEELDGIKANKKLLEARESKLKEELAYYLDSIGYKDTKGSYLVKLNVNGKEKVAKKEARKTVKLNHEKAENLFRELGVWDDVIEVKEVINEDYVEQALLNEKISMQDLESVTDVKTTYAILIKDYKPDEEEGLI